MRKPSLLVIFLTVFIDLIGFGIVLPLLPIYSKDFGANGFMIGAIMAAFSLTQFIFAPIWGRLSDRVGRRPVLLVSTAGAAVSYVLFAVASGFTGRTALFILLGARLFAGACGANITVAQAYIADITPPADRSRRMGLIGMAFGLGFILGPALGSLSFDLFGITGPGWVAASLCTVNLIVAFLVLSESWKPSSEHAAPRPRMAQWAHTFSHPKVGLLIGIFFLATFCFTCFETTLGLLISENFHLDIKNDHHAKEIVGYLFAYCGMVGAGVQGGAIGGLVKRMGEPRLIAVSLMLVALSLAAMPFIHGFAPLTWEILVQRAGLPWLNLLLVLGVLAAGSSLTRPPVFGLISNLTPAHEQGATIGVAQSAGSLARIIGPLFAATLFDYKPALPYLICSGIALVAGLLAWQSLCRSEQPLVSGDTQGAS